MGKDITEAVANADVASLMGAVNGSFLCLGPKKSEESLKRDEYITVEAYFLQTKTDAIKIEPIKKVGQLIFDRKIESLYFDYADKEQPLFHCHLGNPIGTIEVADKDNKEDKNAKKEIARVGVNAIKLTRVEGKKLPRIFITSGQLTGCAFGVLHTNDAIYVLHVGLEGGKEIEYPLQDKCADILHIVQYMIGKTVSKEAQLTRNDLHTQLCDLNIRGDIHFKFDESDSKINIRDNLRFYSYELGVERNGGRADSGCVLFLRNEENVCNIAYRDNVTLNAKKEEDPKKEIVGSPVTAFKFSCTLL